MEQTPGKIRLRLTQIGALFTLLVPVPVVGIIPWYITRWIIQPAFLGVEPLRYVGAVLIVAGCSVYVVGLGHLGHHGTHPIPPVVNIVSAGIYAWTRNPMYSGVIMMLIGQALLFGSRDLLEYALGWFLFFHCFEVFYDEPVLKHKFADVYPAYCERTPRWIPRLPRRG
jgi:protein-S-isoprenylcysteine O-methyltransferase Ste14